MGSFGLGGRFGGAGASYPELGSPLRRRRPYTNLDLDPLASDEALLGDPDPFSGQMLDPDPLGARRNPLEAAAAPPPEPDVRPEDLEFERRLQAEEAPPAAQPSSLQQAADGSGDVVDMSFRGILPPNRPAPVDPPPPEPTGAPPAGEDPDRWSARQHGLPGMLRGIGEFEGRARAAGQASRQGASDILGRAGRSIGNFFTGRPQEAAPAAPAGGLMPPVQAATIPPRAAAAPTRPSLSAVANDDDPIGPGVAPVSTAAPPRPVGIPRKTANGTPLYTNEDLDRVRESGPSRGGFVMGAPERESLESALERTALRELEPTTTSGLTRGQERAIAFEKAKRRAENEARAEQEDARAKKLSVAEAAIDAETEEAIADLRARPGFHSLAPEEQHGREQQKRDVGQERKRSLRQSYGLAWGTTPSALYRDSDEVYR